MASPDPAFIPSKSEIKAVDKAIRDAKKEGEQK